MPQPRCCTYCSQPAVASFVRRVGPARIDPYSSQEADRDPSRCEVVRLCVECRQTRGESLVLAGNND
jgi:hypothetical protein